MNIAVVNYSWPNYNLATDRIANQLRSEGHQVILSPIQADIWSMFCDKAYFSAIFTWDLPRLCRDANLLKRRDIELEIGGPAATAIPQYIVAQTGITPYIGLDLRFEHTLGDYQATFTSRGCPRACNFCLVSKLEGRKIIEYDDFTIPVGRNPFVCDNNILATSWDHQKLVVDKVKHVRNLDFNSGFDDRIFIKDPEKYWRLYSQTDLEAWRFAYDSPEQREPIKVCADFLHDKGVDYRRIIVFCLIGFPGQTFEECQERLQYLVDIGTSPYPQRYRPLDILSKSEYDPGWSEGTPEQLFCYYGVPYIWRSCSWEEYLETRRMKEKVLNTWLKEEV